MEKWTKSSLNEVTIEGVLLSVDLEEAKDNENKDVIRGDVKIQVTQEINGMMKTCEIPVSVYQKKYTKKGTINPAYESALKVKDEMVSVAACGDVAKADRVSIAGNSGSINENLFYGRNQQFVSTPIIRASFINKVAPGTPVVETAKFKNVVVILDKQPELNKDGDTTGRLVLTCGLPQYGGKLDMVKFVAANTNVVNFIDKNWNNNDTVLIGGYINFSSIVDTVAEQSSFGEPIITKRTHTVKELIISGGHDAPLTFEEGAIYTPEQLQEAAQEREGRKEILKNRQAAPATTTPTFGF